MDAIGTALTLAITGAILGFLFQRGRTIAHFDRATGEAELRYPTWFRALGWVCLVLAIALASVPMVFSIEDPLVWYTQGFGAFFLGSGILLLRESRKRITITGELIRSESPWTGVREITWDAVRRVSFSKLNAWLVIADAEKKIRAHLFLEGIPALIAWLRLRTPPEVHSEAVRASENAMRVWGMRTRA